MLYTDKSYRLIFFLLFVAVVSSVSLEGTQGLYGSVKLKWKMEIINIINYMTMILQMGGDAHGICP